MTLLSSRNGPSALLLNSSLLEQIQCPRRALEIAKRVTAMSVSRKRSANSGTKSGEGDLRIDRGSVAGSVVALGKFDALHVGHRALAIQASKMGPPILLSFTGMAEVFNWEKRPPIVAPCDRKRVMSLWAELCGGVAPEECHLEFARVRTLSPLDFVQRLAKDLQVKGVVAGANYRFGYKAAGDASLLVQLCGKFDLDVFVVDPVMDESRSLDKATGISEIENDREKGQVSSTRVRKALSAGDMFRVSKLLGRDHRLIFAMDGCTLNTNRIVAPMANVLNQLPKYGIYDSRIYVRTDGELEVEEAVRSGVAEVGHGQVQVSLREGSFGSCWSQGGYVGVDLKHQLFDYVT